MQFFSDLLNQRIRWCSPCGTSTGYGALYNWWAATGSQVGDDETYGAYYNWWAVKYNVGGTTIAPTGWHVPTYADWTTMYKIIDPPGGWNCVNEMREVGTAHWHAPNTGATNSSGFTLLPGGYRNDDGTWPPDLTYDCAFWYSDGSDPPPFSSVSFGVYDSWGVLTAGPNTGIQIRCVKDDAIDPGTMTDYDGNIYNTVVIGTQVWMKENLKVRHYRNGTIIPIIDDNTTWASDLSGAMSLPKSIVSNPVLLSPTGWHLPTCTELETLRTFIDPVNIANPNINIAGGPMKETGTDYWLSPNIGATNSTGFNARGSGTRDGTDGSFKQKKEVTVFWNSLDSSAADGGAGSLSCYDEIFVTACNVVDTKNKGNAIRLIKDDSTDPGIMIDYDGNVYPTVKIGTQVWMAENLRVTHYNDGTPITVVTSDAAWATLTTEAMCFYNNLP